MSEPSSSAITFVPLSFSEPPAGFAHSNVPSLPNFAFWDIDTADWLTTMTAGEISDNIIANIEGGKGYRHYNGKKQSYTISRPVGGGVVLMHDIHQRSVDATALFLEYAANNDIEIVPLSEVDEFAYDGRECTLGNEDDGEEEEDVLVEIKSFPFNHSADTRYGKANMDFDSADTCRPGSGSERGKEIVYSFTVANEGVVRAELSDGWGVDIDLHLLTSLDEKDCIARHNNTIDEVILPGTYYIIADTWVSSSGRVYDGSYDIHVDFTPNEEPEDNGEEPVKIETYVIGGVSGNYTTESAAHLKWETAVSSLNCRAGAGSANAVLAVISSGDVVESTNSVLLDNGRPWFQMRLQSGIECYVRARDRYITPVTE